MTQIGISFAPSTKQTGELNGLLNPDKEAIHRLLDGLPKSDKITAGQVEFEVDRLIKAGRQAATSEAYRRGWDKVAGLDAAIEQLKLLDDRLRWAFEVAEGLPPRAVGALVRSNIDERGATPEALMRSGTGRDTIALALYVAQQRIRNAIDWLERDGSGELSPPEVGTATADKDEDLKALKLLDKRLRLALEALKDLPREAHLALLLSAEEDAAAPEALTSSSAGQDALKFVLDQGRLKSQRAIDWLDGTLSEDPFSTEETAAAGAKDAVRGPVRTKPSANSLGFAKIKERITSHATFSFERLTGRRPTATKGTGDGKPTRGALVEFLAKLFEILGFSASPRNQGDVISRRTVKAGKQAKGARHQKTT